MWIGVVSYSLREQVLGDFAFEGPQKIPWTGSVLKTASDVDCDTVLHHQLQSLFRYYSQRIQPTGFEGQRGARRSHVSMDSTAVCFHISWVKDLKPRGFYHESIPSIAQPNQLRYFSGDSYIACRCPRCGPLRQIYSQRCAGLAPKS